MTTAAHTSLPTLDDMVFEGRNKAYGAYVLRKVYGRHVVVAVGIATGLLALLIAVPLIVQKLWPAAVIAAPFDLPVTPPIELGRYTTEEPKPAAPTTAATVTVRPRIATIPTRVVPNNEVVKPTPSEDIPVSDGPVVEGPVAKEGTGAVSTGTEARGKDTLTQPAEPTVTKPFIHAEVMPEFAGGAAALAKYMQRNLHYPSQALRASVEGKVFISFTVTTDGTITDVEVLKGLGYGTDEEAARVIRQMPAWKPGYQNNHAVPVRYTLPITFQYE